MAAREGLRRIVRMISFLAWMGGIACILIAISAVISNPSPTAVITFAAIGLFFFCLIQGVAWIIAGFSGNTKDSDGLIRGRSLWKWKRSPKATPLSINVGSTGVGGALTLLIIGFLVLGPARGVLNTFQNLDKAEAAYPKLLELANWHNYKLAVWSGVAAMCAIYIAAAYKLLRVHQPSSVIFAIFALWVAGPGSTLLDAAAASLYFQLPLAKSFGSEEVIGGLVVSSIWAVIWTLYLKCSRRVQNTYERQLLTPSSVANSPPSKREPTL